MTFPLRVKVCLWGGAAHLRMRVPEGTSVSMFRSLLVGKLARLLPVLSQHADPLSHFQLLFKVQLLFYWHLADLRGFHSCWR
eukprot:EC690772.1.p2 GENE.EC690772.1~~EC690772.1.p2  ORF type:complete len:94 (+),score=15.05 EC690772.1:37-282(+)